MKKWGLFFVLLFFIGMVGVFGADCSVDTDCTIEGESCLASSCVPEECEELLSVFADSYGSKKDRDASYVEIFDFDGDNFNGLTDLGILASNFDDNVWCADKLSSSSGMNSLSSNFVSDCSSCSDGESCLTSTCAPDECIYFFSLFADIYGSREGDADYDSRFELDGDGIVSLTDLAIVAVNIDNREWCVNRIGGIVGDFCTVDTDCSIESGEVCGGKECCVPKVKVDACGNRGCGDVTDGCLAGDVYSCGSGCDAGDVCSSGSCISSCTQGFGPNACGNNDYCYAEDNNNNNVCAVPYDCGGGFMECLECNDNDDQCNFDSERSRCVEDTCRECIIADDCSGDSGEYCIDNSCVECVDAATDCDAGDPCVFGVCVECVDAAADCDAGDSCFSGKCVTEVINYWADVNGNRLESGTNVSLGGTVRMISNVGPNYTITRDGEPFIPARNVSYWGPVVEGTNYTFNSSSGFSDNYINVIDKVDNYPLSVEIVRPACGAYFNVTERRTIEVNLTDFDDVVSGNVSVGGRWIRDFNSSLGNTISVDHTFNEAGNIEIVVWANNIRGEVFKATNNVMVVNTSKNDYYVAACIDEPRNFERFNSSTVFFNASSSRGLKFDVADGGSFEVIGKEKLLFNWRFFLGLSYWGMSCVGLGIENCPGSDQPVYAFNRSFPTVNDNKVFLSVSIPESEMD